MPVRSTALEDPLAGRDLDEGLPDVDLRTGGEAGGGVRVRFASSSSINRCRSDPRTASNAHPPTAAPTITMSKTAVVTF